MKMSHCLICYVTQTTRRISMKFGNGIYNKSCLKIFNLCVLIKVCSWIRPQTFVRTVMNIVTSKTEKYFPPPTEHFYVLIRPNKMQQYAGIYLRQVYSTCFGRPSRPSSGAQKNLTEASGTGRGKGATTLLQRGLIRRKVVAPLLWPVPEAAFTVFCTPDDGRDGRPKHVE